MKVFFASFLPLKEYSIYQSNALWTIQFKSYYRSPNRFHQDSVRPGMI